MSDKKTTTTIRDLQTFIDAVEFASDQEEWVPSARQWKRIRDMINSLEETKPAPAPAVAPVQPVSAAPLQYATPQFAMPPQLPQGPAQMPQMAHPGPRPALSPLLAAHEQMPVRTPDIDTGNGKPYTSSFAS